MVWPAPSLARRFRTLTLLAFKTSSLSWPQCGVVLVVALRPARIVTGTVPSFLSLHNCDLFEYLLVFLYMDRKLSINGNSSSGLENTMFFYHYGKYHVIMFLNFCWTNRIEAKISCMIWFKLIKYLN